MTKIPKPRFNLKTPKSKETTLIFLIYRYRGKKMLYSTGININPEDWDFNTQRPIEQEGRLDLSNTRRLIDDLASLCKSIYVEANYGMLNITSFKDSLEHKLNGTPSESQKERLSFIEFMSTEMAEMKAANMKHGSFKIFKRHAAILKEFSENRGAFEYEDVDWNFRLELIDWLTSRNVQLAYGNKTLSILRQFLERSRRKKIHSNTEYHGAGWSVPSKKAQGQKITLNPNELNKLASIELTGMEKKARDLFLIGAGTGQRFSDFSIYTPDNFYTTANDIPILSVISIKTDTPAKVPLNIFPWLIPILEEYNYYSPKLAMQNLNDTIKVICEKIGLDSRVLKIEQYFGRKARVEKTYLLKYQAISSHACRRSFATNLYRMGYSIAQIMPMTGHSSESQLREYIGVDAEENAEQIALDIRARQANM